MFLFCDCGVLEWPYRITEGLECCALDLCSPCLLTSYWMGPKQKPFCLVRGVRFLVVRAPSSLAHRQVGVQAKGLRAQEAPFIAGVAQNALQMNHSCVLTLTT